MLYSCWRLDPPPPLPATPRSLLNVSFRSSLRRAWGCGTAQSEKEREAYELIRDEHRRLGPISYGEANVLALFILMVALWFTRDPRFMAGWATHVFNANAE